MAGSFLNCRVIASRVGLSPPHGLSPGARPAGAASGRASPRRSRLLPGALTHGPAPRTQTRRRPVPSWGRRLCRSGGGRGQDARPEGTEPSGRAGVRALPSEGLTAAPLARRGRRFTWVANSLLPSLPLSFLPSFPEPVVSAEREWSPPGPSPEKLSAAVPAR